MSEPVTTPAAETPSVPPPSAAEVLYGKDGKGAPAPSEDAPKAPEVPAPTPPAQVDDKKPDEPPAPAPAPKEEPAKPDAPKEPEGKAPEAVELKVPAGSELSAAHVDSIKAFAKEKGLNQEQAQAILDREHSSLVSAKAAQDESIKQKRTSWITEASKDSEIGGEKFTKSVESAKRFLDKFGSEKLKQELDSTGLGNHPELVRIFARAGQQMSDDNYVHGGGNAPREKTIEEIFYPSKPK